MRIKNEGSKASLKDQLIFYIQKNFYFSLFPNIAYDVRLTKNRIPYFYRGKELNIGCPKHNVRIIHGTHCSIISCSKKKATVHQASCSTFILCVVCSNTSAWLSSSLINLPHSVFSVSKWVFNFTIGPYLGSIF